MIIDGVGGYYPQVNRTSNVNTSSAATAGRSAVDTVSFSPKALLTGLSAQFMGGAGADGVITLDEIRAFRDTAVGLTQTQLQNTVNNLNINASGRLNIDIDPYNKVIVSGGTAEENSALAAALQENDRFISAWNAASGTSSLLAAAEASVPFQNAYCLDQKRAVDQYSRLFNKDWHFKMYFEDGGIGYSVT